MKLILQGQASRRKKYDNNNVTLFMLLRYTFQLTSHSSIELLNAVLVQYSSPNVCSIFPFSDS